MPSARKATEDRGTVRGQGVEFQADHVKMIGMADIAANSQRLHGRQLPESLVILPGDGLPPGQGGRQLGQLA